MALLSSPSHAQYEHEDGVEEEEEEEEKEGYGEHEELVEEDELVKVWYVSGTRGVRGDVLVSPRTDFPELRFATSGKRWLRARATGKMQVRELELVRGKSHKGKKGWIMRFDGVDSLDEGASDSIDIYQQPKKPTISESTTFITGQ